MTREEEMDIFSMRLDGYTYDQIGKKYGVTRERVRQILNVKGVRAAYKNSPKWIFPNIRPWMRKNHMSGKEMACMLGTCSNSFSSYMTGKRDIPKHVIDKLLQITGMTYEECFYKPEE